MSATVPVATPPTGTPRLERHHELAYVTGVEGLVARTVPFLVEAARDGAPVMVALPPAHWEAVRHAAGPAADRATFVDMTREARNPATLLAAWLDFAETHADSPVPLRGVGEPVHAGRRPPEIAECQIHEALVDIGLGHLPLWLLCPYDVTTLDAHVLAEARRSHAYVTHDGTPMAADYAGTEHVDRLAAAPLPEPDEVDDAVRFAMGDLGSVRRLVGRHAEAAGLDPSRADDLVLAANELVANSVDHGGGGGTLRTWRDDDALVVEVRDHGYLPDLLAGRQRPDPHQDRGRGLWMAHRLADLVQVRRTPDGTVVRLYAWLDA